MDRSAWECAILHGSSVEHYRWHGMLGAGLVKIRTRGLRQESVPAKSAAKLRSAWTREDVRSHTHRPHTSHPYTASSAHALGAAILGDVYLLRRCYLQQRLAPDMHKAQFARRKQSVDCFFHSRPRDEVREEVLGLSLIHRNHAIQIFRDQRGERFGDRNSHALAHHIRRPAR